ncbi:MAG: IPT/TIG domain-containing protein [Candidatus Sulfotelmatobacter sp.]
MTEPSGTLTSNKTFRVVPQVTSFSPANGPVSTSVVITGESFIGVIDVHFGNVKVTSFTVDSDTQITATVPAGAETGKISVCTPGGSGDSATSFTVTP